MSEIRFNGKLNLSSKVVITSSPSPAVKLKTKAQFHSPTPIFPVVFFYPTFQQAFTISILSAAELEFGLTLR